MANASTDGSSVAPTRLERRLQLPSFRGFVTKLLAFHFYNLTGPDQRFREGGIDRPENLHRFRGRV